MTELNFNGLLIKAEDLKDHVLLHLLHQMTNAIDAQTKALEKLNERLDILESLRDQQRGAKMLVEWLFKYAPWLITALTIVAAAMFKAKGAH